MDISPDLKVTQPTVTLISNTFIKIENYESIITYDTNNWRSSFTKIY